MADIAREQMAAALEPFINFYNDIRFNLRKQPRPTDAAVEERGERVAVITWADFYKLDEAYRTSLTTRLGEK
jgi:hypothetical protein